jgi:hypothetical protein
MDRHSDGWVNVRSEPNLLLLLVNATARLTTQVVCVVAVRGQLINMFRPNFCFKVRSLEVKKEEEEEETKLGF